MHLNSTYWGKFYDKVVENQNKMLLVCPVKPVYNGHPRDSKVAVVQKWSFCNNLLNLHSNNFQMLSQNVTQNK